MRKTNLYVRFVLLAGILMLFASNAHAFLITSELNAFTIQLVPATPSSTMSLEWTGDYYASASVEAYQRKKNNLQSIRKNSFEWFDKPSNTTLEVATDKANMTFSISGNDALFTVDFGEDTLDFLRCLGHWGFSRDFSIQGDGWLQISAVHAVDYESTPFNFNDSSRASLSLTNYSSDSSQNDSDNLHGYYSSEWTDILSVGLFFNDGDSGRIETSLGNYFSNSEGYNPVPIPGAAWLLVCGLSCLVGAKKIL